MKLNLEKVIAIVIGMTMLISYGCACAVLFRHDYGGRQGHLELITARVLVQTSTATFMLTGEVSH